MGIPTIFVTGGEREDHFEYRSAGVPWVGRSSCPHNESFRVHAQSPACRASILRGGYGAGTTGLINSSSNPDDITIPTFVPFTEATSFLFDGHRNLSGASTVTFGELVSRVMFTGRCQVIALEAKTVLPKSEGDTVMRKSSLLVTLSLFWCALALTQDQDFSKVQVKVTKVAGNVYMLEGEGGNIGASVGDDGIVLVDDQYAPLADKIQAALRGITDKPIRLIINTHFHLDHTDGNAYFQSQAPIIAHDNVRKRLESGGVAGNGGSLHFNPQPQPKESLPILTFDHDVTVHLNGEDIRALYFPAGHTDGDSIIFFPKSNVVHMGDDFLTYGFPFIDIDSGGSINGMIDAMDKVVAMLPADVKVIPGHGAVASLDDMRAYLKMLNETRDIVQNALNQRKTFDQMKQARILEPWKKYSWDFITEDVYLETLYNSLKGRNNGKFIKHN